MRSEGIGCILLFIAISLFWILAFYKSKKLNDRMKFGLNFISCSILCLIICGIGWVNRPHCNGQQYCGYAVFFHLLTTIGIAGTIYFLWSIFVFIHFKSTEKRKSN